MGNVNLESGLKEGLKKASGPDSGPVLDENRLPPALTAFFEKHEELKVIPVPIIRKAWFTTAHLILANEARVADMGCHTGEMTYAMAVMNPYVHFTGIDLDKKLIARAKQKFQLPNLEFRVGDITKTGGLEENSLDGIINSFILNEVYSASKYHDRAVLDAMEQQFKLLKPEGLMFLRDYPLPPPGEMVLLEMKDIRSTGPDIKSLSEPDLLIWYSEHARPKQDPNCPGFFMEELPPRFPDTRLFRLPYKWFYEFIQRKDDRARFEENLSKEYAFFTKREFRKALRVLGARLLYTSPHWDDAEIRRKFEGRFRLYQDDGTPLGMPATSFIAIAQKMGEGRSLRLLERRPSNKHNNRVKITAMRNERTGKLVDVVSRDVNVTSVIPYRIDENGELRVYIHEGSPRGIANVVPRSGKNLDEKFWSGHLTEAIPVDSAIVAAVPEENVKAVMRFARDHLGLKPVNGALLEKGPGFYPAPDFIAEHTPTRYLQVQHSENLPEPKHIVSDMEGFTTKGRIREVRAQALLDAMSVGYIPNACLEVQIQVLFDRLELKSQSWNETPMTLPQGEPETLFDPVAFAKLKSGEDKTYQPVRGTAGQIRAVQSIFVDEGWVDGGLSGLSARDMEFIIPDENTTNKAVVLPLTRNAQGTVMAGITTEYLPVPQRFQGNGLTIRAPSFDLPKEIMTMSQAQKMIADKFGVPVQNVYKLGESFFCHVGLTPQRVFPFAVAAHRIAPKMLGGPCQFYPMKKFYDVLFRIMDWNFDQSLIYAIYKAQRSLADTSEMNLKIDFGRQMLYESEVIRPEMFEDMTGLAATQATLAASAPSQFSEASIGGGGGSASSKPNNNGQGDKGDTDSGGNASGHIGGEPAMVADSAAYVQKQVAKTASATARGGKSGGSGSMGGGRPRAKARESSASRQGKAQEIESNYTSYYRSEPVFDSDVEEFVERPATVREGPEDRLESNNRNRIRSGA